jgi:hypothetical protein
MIVTDLTVTIDSEIASAMRQLANEQLVQRLLCGQDTVPCTKRSIVTINCIATIAAVIVLWMHPIASTSMEHSKIVLFCAVLCCAVLCCAVLCCAGLGCAVLCCAVLCCAVLCCAVLCWAGLGWAALALSRAPSATSFQHTNAAKSRVTTKKLYLLVLPQQHQKEQSWQLLGTEQPDLLLNSHDRLLPNQARPHHLPEARSRHAAAVLLRAPAFTHCFCLHIHDATNGLEMLNTH